ncbi:MAG: hypothetical protein GC150_07720 [Rhizobiales bacterium]|nr:hypothetical protein [Hyphomicrobiales bacterium]
MRFTVPFLLGLAAFALTVYAANLTSFRVNEDLIFDIGLAGDAIGYRLERVFAMPPDPALAIGLFLLTIPALVVFHLFRLLFGGSTQRLRAEGRRMTERPRFTEVERLLAEEALTAPTPATAAPTSATSSTTGATASAQRSTPTGTTPPATPSAAATATTPASTTRPLSAGIAGPTPSTGSERRETASLGERLAFSERAAEAGADAPVVLGAAEGKTDDASRSKWRAILENRPNLGALRQQASGIRASIKRMRGTGEGSGGGSSGSSGASSA